MLKKVVSVTRRQHISCQASLEAFMACGLGACQGCALKTSSGDNKAYCLVCQDGPVFDAKGIDWKNLK
jgi:dihydroorotate dehydrogenase electron transfer subunit